jgi:NAD(P)-dependent dehydrogenase (short-subunit alcohol dehydrogenase family)
VRTVLVTGATRGIGREVARQLLDRGERFADVTRSAADLLSPRMQKASTVPGH